MEFVKFVKRLGQAIYADITNGTRPRDSSTIKSVISEFFHGMYAREEKLAKLRKEWDSVPKGTPIVFIENTMLCQETSKDQPPGVPSHNSYLPPLRWHLAKAGHGAMLMNITWPVVRHDPAGEMPVRFVLWCNYSNHEFYISLYQFSGTLPFRVLS